MQDIIGIVKSEIWCKVWLFGKTETPCKHLVYKALMMFGIDGAEREGFEPTVGSSPTAVFKTAAINRSAISPGAKIEICGNYKSPE